MKGLERDTRYCPGNILFEDTGDSYNFDNWLELESILKGLSKGTYSGSVSFENSDSLLIFGSVSEIRIMDLLSCIKDSDDNNRKTI